VSFKFERPFLRELGEVTREVFKASFNQRVPTFVETDGAGAENQERKSPGGRGAILYQEKDYCTLFGPQADTSNNEMQYMAMIRAMDFIPRHTYVVIESGSWGCIGGLTRYRKVWERNGWRRNDGQEVISAAIMGPLAREVDQRWVYFLEIKGHSSDERNDLADKLMMKARYLQAKEVVVQPIFRAVIAKKEKFFGFDRFSIPALANMYEFWQKVQDHCRVDIGRLEDYEIWHNRYNLEEPMRDEEQYNSLRGVPILLCHQNSELRGVACFQKKGKPSGFPAGRFATRHMWRLHLKKSRGQNQVGSHHISQLSGHFGHRTRMTAYGEAGTQIVTQRITSAKRIASTWLVEKTDILGRS
jgi:ribonuclease HI